MKLLKEVRFIASTTQVRDVVRKKNGIMWEKFPSGGPPPHLPPVWEFSHLFTVFLPFYKPLNWKKTEKNMGSVWVRPLPPLWEFFPHNPVFF